MDIDFVLERGVSQILPSRESLKKLIQEKQITLYQGFDPTNSSLHIGNLIGIRKLAQFQKLGCKIIFLIGDFTALIGDPTDKASARSRLTKKEIEENAKSYKEQVANIIDFEGENKAEIKYNSEWLSKLSFEDIAEITSHFTVQQMIERDFFQERIKNDRPIFMHEFLYPIMQGYDSVVMGVDLEIGGNDQLFNILAGRTLVKSMKNKEKFVLTMKLLTDPTGKKMGKSEGNTINLTDTPNDIYGKIMALPDTLIDSLAELITDIPLTSLPKEDPFKSKKIIAKDLVRQLHGEKISDTAEKYFENTFQKKQLPNDIVTIHLDGRSNNLIDILVGNAILDSKSEARRLILQNAIERNGEIINDPKYVLPDNEPSVIKIGKSRFVKIVK